MKINYDKTVDALSLRFNNAPYRKSVETKEGIIMDYDEKDKLIGIEILNVSKRLVPSFVKPMRQGAPSLETQSG